MAGLTLPPGYVARAATRSDAAEIAALINACDTVDIGGPNTSARALKRMWAAPDHAPNDTLLVTGADGRLLAVLNRFPEGPHLVEFEGYVAPEARGHGIGTALLAEVERDAAQQAHSAPDPLPEVRLTTTAWDVNTAARRLLERNGYALIQRWERMLIEMSEPPEPALALVGITIRPFIPGRDNHPFAEAMDEALSEEPRHIPITPEQWRHIYIESARDFDPTLCFVAEAGGQVVGGALCDWETPAEPETGQVRALATRRPWRRRGIGLALARTAFAAFYARGKRRIGLGVDPDTPTHAHALFRRAGMRAVNTICVYERSITASEAAPPQGALASGDNS